LVAGHLGRIVFFVFGIVLVEVLLCLFRSVEDRPLCAVEITGGGQTSTIAFDVFPRLWRIFDIVPNLINRFLSLIVG
jgi:hypothetical protein